MIKNLVFMMVTMTVAMTVFGHKNAPKYLKDRRNGGELRMIVVFAIDDDGTTYRMRRCVY